MGRYDTNLIRSEQDQPTIVTRESPQAQDSQNAGFGSSQASENHYVELGLQSCTWPTETFLGV
jgi:hypothetical protein